MTQAGPVRAGPAFFSVRPTPPGRGGPAFPKEDKTMMEIHWGQPLSFVISPEGEVQKFSTIEQARYWLHRKWPVADEARSRALDQLDAAMHCLVPVGSARRAFIAAARTAGFVPETLSVQSGRPVAA